MIERTELYEKKNQSNTTPGSSKLLLDRRELCILTTLRRSHTPPPQSPGSSLRTCGTKSLAIERHSVWHFATEVWKLIQSGSWVLSSYKGWDTFTYFLKLIRAWRISFQTFLVLSSVKTESKTRVFWRASLLRGHELHHPHWHFLSTSCVRYGVKGCVQVDPSNPVNEHDVWTNTTIS